MPRVDTLEMPFGKSDNNFSDIQLRGNSACLCGCVRGGRINRYLDKERDR